ncbi:Uncharacterised protein [Burkholderia pseudomallei]|nr:Uncharacterised protein [Burkholderia pseudomallei]VBQ49565.1 Uncharacterised protein [Burkholderia pseudomallei]
MQRYGPLLLHSPGSEQIAACCVVICRALLVCGVTETVVV